MPELLFSVIQVMVSWVLISITMVGVGLVFNKLLAIEEELNNGMLLSCFWSGLALILIFLDVWHLFWAVNTVSLSLVLILAFFGFYLNRAILIRHLKPTRLSRRATCFLAIFLLVCLIASFRVLGKVIDYNMGLYQLQIVQWYSQFPVIPGLANLHGCLAYNQSYFLYMSLIECCPLFLPAFRIGNAVFLLITIAQILININNLEYFSKNKMASLFQLALLFLLFYETVAGTVNSVAPEILGHCLVILIALFTLNSLTNDSDSLRSAKNINIYSFVLICILAFTVKFTIGLFSGICLLMVLFKSPDLINKKNLLIGSMMISITIIPWIIHGIILSGCLLYPYAATALDFDWTVPSASIQTCSNWIYGWSRLPYKHWTQIENQWHWIPEWFRFVVASYPCYTVVPWSISFVSMVILFCKWDRFQKTALYLAWAGAIGGIPLFLLAPDPRYTAGILWVVSAVLLATIMEPYLMQKNWIKLVSGWLVVCVLFPLWYVIPLNLFPGSGVVEIPVIQSWQFKTRSGLAVNIPKSGDQVWNSAIPSTPYPNPFLKLREDNNINSGFRSDAKGDGVGVDP